MAKTKDGKRQEKRNMGFAEPKVHSCFDASEPVRVIVINDPRHPDRAATCGYKKTPLGPNEVDKL